MRRLYKTTIFLKFISIVKDIENLYKTYALIKFCNKRNYYINKRKTTILSLVLIDICKLLLALRFEYKYFVEIVDNYSCKI